jgi:uncharacterized protein YktB (UPF0637 family)
MTEKQKELYEAILKKELAAYLTKNLADNIEEVPEPTEAETEEKKEVAAKDLEQTALERRKTRTVQKKEYVELDEDDLITIKQTEQAKSHKIPFYIRTVILN